jgi:hypothetical protein
MMQPGDGASAAYGPLPYGLFEDIRPKVIAALKARFSPHGAAH